MKIIVLLILFFFISFSVSTQESMKKIPLKEGSVSGIKHNALNINTLLQVHDETSSGHGIGGLYLRVQNNGETIVDFSIDSDSTSKEYNTKAYKNYFLTFTIENGNKYLIVEQARFGIPFTLSGKQSTTIGEKEDAIEIEITDFIHEWGYDAPPEAENRNYFEAINYTLTVKVKEVIKRYSFYNSEIEGNYAINLENHSIVILSDTSGNSSCLIEMIVNSKK